MIRSRIGHLVGLGIEEEERSPSHIILVYLPIVPLSLTFYISVFFFFLFIKKAFY